MEFTELTQRLSPTLKRITYRLNDGRYPFLSDQDLYQEALVHLWQADSRGELAGKTDSYILQGCYFHLKNYLRKIKDKNRLVSIEEFTFCQDISLGAADPFLPDTGSSFDCRQRLNDKMLAEAIMNNGLTTREKSILRFFAEGLTTRQIGEKLKVSHVSIVKTMARIRVKCGRHLDCL